MRCDRDMNREDLVAAGWQDADETISGAGQLAVGDGGQRSDRPGDRAYATIPQAWRR